MKLNQLKAGVILSYLSVFLSTIISIIYTPIMLNILGKSEYGLYQLVSSVVAYLGLLTFGFGSSYVRFYSKFKVNNDFDAIAKLNGMFLIVFSALGLIALFAGLTITSSLGSIFSERLSILEVKTAKVLMTILVVNLALSFPFSIFNSYITANEKYFFQRILEIIRIVTNPLLTLPLLLLGYGSIGLVCVTTFLNISIALANIIYCIKKLGIQISFRNFNFTLLKEVAVFSSFIFINIVVDNINWNVDKFLLGIYQGTSAVAVYSIATQLNNYYLTFSLTISSVLVPRVNQIAFSEDANTKLNELFIKVGRLQFIVLSLILSGLYFFGLSFISLWIGNEYADSYIILLILVTPVTIPLVQTLGMEIQRAKNLHRFRALIYLGIAIANVLISIPLTKAYSGVGSAIGTAIALFIGNGIIMNIYYHKKCDLNVINFWREILKFTPALIVPITLGYFIVTQLQIITWTSLAFYIGIYSIIFFISMWLFAFNDYEKDLLLKTIKRIQK